MTRPHQHTYTLTLTVRNSPGVLVRCAQVFSRRGHAIESLSVTPIPNAFATSHMIIAASGKEDTYHHITQQLKKLVDVLHVAEKGSVK